MTTPRKEKKREARREEKAEKAAVLDEVVKPLRSCLCYCNLNMLSLELSLIFVDNPASIEKELFERLKRGDYDAVGIDDDDEETIAIDRKRLRRDSQRKLEKDEPRAKPKRVRVLVEEVPPLDVPKLLAYLVRQSGPFLDQIGVRRDMA
ncbi:hypothetical protein LOK49_LG12G02960 [Camellia lanceoleosa]|uniref:Uncharacterized protein n=1 Tax=Camellia lanceoleosa TaxID=1840588 RepID=A0ACC0FVI9_9ERIC|nr:hypothetical protein LOK49_LG12G02960 [Camellia lanceoleosa]